MSSSTRSSKQGLESEVAFSTAIPSGYIHVPKGNIYITRNCRKLTHELNQTVYLVKSNNGTIVGIRVPRDVHDRVVEAHDATAETRAATVQKKDEFREGVMKRAVEKMFPLIPDRDVNELLSRTLKKRSRRVGRSTNLTIDEVAVLAVRAHVRHRHTVYDEVIRESGQTIARKMVGKQVERTLRIWAGGFDVYVAKSGRNSRKKPVIMKKGSGGLSKRQIKRREGKARKMLGQALENYEQKKNTDSKQNNHKMKPVRTALAAKNDFHGPSKKQLKKKQRRN